MASGETKIWLTAKRLARGPEKADEEIRRWAKTAFRPAKLYGDVRALRTDAIASRSAHMGSRHIAREPRPLVTWGELAALAGVTVGAFFLGRYLGRRRQQHQAPAPAAVHGAAPSAASRYLTGTYALCA